MILKKYDVFLISSRNSSEFYNLRKKRQLTTSFCRCLLVTIDILKLYICKQKKALTSVTLPWRCPFLDQSEGELGQGAVWFLERYWVMCTSVALMTLMPWARLWELTLTLPLTIILRQRARDPVRGAEAQWQWVAHRSRGAKRKEP